MGLSVLKLGWSWANRGKLIILSVTKGLGTNHCHGLQDPPAGHCPFHTSQDRDSQSDMLIRRMDEVTNSWQLLFLDAWERQTIMSGGNKAGTLWPPSLVGIRCLLVWPILTQQED